MWGFTAEAMVAPIQVGERVGNYIVTRLLGAGAMGSVYLAEHPQIGRSVAIKVLAEHLAHLPGFSGRFMSEAKAISLIKHPNVIDVYDFGQTAGGQLYYLMDHLEGCNLSEVMAHHGPMALDVATYYVEQMCAGLQAAHDAGVIHRDLKPDNIFVLRSSPPEVKLLDFGIAKLVDQPAKMTATATGVVMGSPFTIAPEQAKGEIDRISPATDIYSLGVTTFWMLAGQPPFRGEAAAVILAKHITESPPPLATFVPSLPRGVTEVIDGCLSKDPDQRPATATEIARAFIQHRLAAGARSHRRGASPVKRLTDDLAELFARRTPPPQPAVSTTSTAPVAPGRSSAVEPEEPGSAAPTPNITTLRGATGELVPIYTDDDEDDDRIPRSRALPWLFMSAVVAIAGTAAWYLSVHNPGQSASPPSHAHRSVTSMASPERPSGPGELAGSPEVPDHRPGKVLGAAEDGRRLVDRQTHATERRVPSHEQRSGPSATEPLATKPVSPSRAGRKRADAAARAKRLAARGRRQYRKAFSGALKARALGDTGRAIALALDASQSDPSRPEPFRLLGALYRDQGQHKYSASYYKEYLALRPDAPDAAYILQLLER